jgi:hypothetical protein
MNPGEGRTLVDIYGIRQRIAGGDSGTSVSRTRRWTLMASVGEQASHCPTQNSSHLRQHCAYNGRGQHSPVIKMASSGSAVGMVKTYGAEQTSAHCGLLL